MKAKDIKSLKKRYLVWLYKSVRDELDRVERKFTQLDIDRFILNELNKSDKDKAVSSFIGQFQDYIQNKENSALSLKFENKKIKPEYLFLSFKLEAIEKAIYKELGKAGLNQIKGLYEKEMIKRILGEREEKV